MPKIDVDDDMYSVLEARAEEKGHDDTEEYIEYLLKQIVEKIRREKETEDDGYSEEEEKKVKKRLKDLGYMD